MSPMTIDNQLQKELEEKRQRREFARNVLEQIQPVFRKQLKMQLAEGNEAIEYRVCFKPLISFGRLDRWRRRGLVLQLLKPFSREYDYKIVVFDLRHVEVAKKLAAFLTLVYKADNIKLITAHRPEPISSYVDF